MLPLKFGHGISTGDHSEVLVTVYVSQTYCPPERSMCNDSSTTLELLPLKWVIMEKYHDYLLGSTFKVYTYDNPLT